jgi:glycosyltransferase involved in cell wall biosynthesis
VKKKKKLLFLINTLGGGGAERVLVNLINKMDHRQYHITIRTLIDKGENKMFLSDKVNYEYVLKNSFKGINFLHLLPKKWVYNKIAKGDFDVIVVYLHGVLTKIVSNAPESQKTIAYLHANMLNSPFLKSFGAKEQIQNCFKSYNAIVSVSQSVEDTFKQVSGINKKLYVIYNTFDLEEIKNKSVEKTELSLKNKSKTLNICSVGKLNKVKGYERLISVVGKLKKEGYQFNLTIVGDGSERQSLEALIEQENLNNTVNLTGHQKNPYKFIADSDLFISSSYSEGFSSVVAESIILGIPVLTTNTSGMKEILGENNEYGMIVKNSEKGLYKGIKKLLEQKELLAHYKMKAKQRAKFFSPEKTVKDVEKLIETVCQ